jgi:heme exporter protein B
LKIFLLKEVQTEIRRQSALSALAMYVVSSVFVCYTAMGIQAGNLNPQTWSALFWIILLFSSFGIVGKSFGNESKGVLIYYHCLLSPGSLIMAKMIYAILLTSALSIAGWLIFITLMGNPVTDKGMFLLCLFLGSSGFGSSLTLISAISSRAGNSGVLMAVLGFPVVLSIVLLCIRITKYAIDGLGWAAGMDELISLGGISIISAAASFLLFPYIWRS